MLKLEQQQKEKSLTRTIRILRTSRTKRIVRGLKFEIIQKNLNFLVQNELVPEFVPHYI
ncbi:MAG: hypothetical protein HLUCCX10_07125 [Algoriphagus marincola HL-49]|uniref:Uncharacterized protein n=1 Tax=Algoriphagus marincola HL-49 TaxID=1305737 RepID=A0A0P7YA93_9BACT|nr:MAG: hypothetical protein HLUCCX10_07125 [Algoriphagus marincola HL-49]